MHRFPHVLRRFSPLLLLLISGLCLFAYAATPATSTPAERSSGRVIVLGFDGGAHDSAQRFMLEGKMPHLQGLSETGTFAPLGTTYSAESPVAWAALNTGQNPSKTGVPGFVKRALMDGLDEVSANGDPSPSVGHQINETRQVAEMQTGPLIGFLARYDSTSLMAMVAAAVFLAFLLGFKFILRLPLVPSVALALLLALVGGAGARKAKSYIPESIPNVVGNPVKVEAFWDQAAHNGAKAVIIDAAMAWDRPHVEGTEVLGGLGLPDCRGQNGQWFLYTSAGDEDDIAEAPEGSPSPTAGTIFRLPAWSADSSISSAIYGPVDFVAAGALRKRITEIEERLKPSTGIGWKEGSKLREEKKELRAQLDAQTRVEVPMTIVRRAGGANITIDGQLQDLDVGVWSDWYKLGFELNPLVKANAVTRVKILEEDEGDGRFRLFVNTLDIDPEDPQFWQPVSQPPSFSAELAGRIGGPFETFGWACATMPFKDKVIDAKTMLEDIEFTMQWREKVTREALERGDFDLLMAVFSTPDRVQHMCYQFYDKQHPLYDEAKASQKMTFFGREIELREAIPVIYEQIDRIIGWVKDEYLKPEDTLIVCADHGFQSFRHQVRLNNWLAREGYLKVRDGLSLKSGGMLRFIDWAETRAYAMGLGMIYLNREGRERQGIVPPAQSRALMEEIAGKLRGLTDERGANSVPVVEQVVFIDDVHDGPYRDLEGDMMVGFKPTYRVSWGTTTGGIGLRKNEKGEVVAGSVFAPNLSNWSGGHVSVAPMHVSGIFASNRKIEVPADGVHLLHIAPTTLQLLGVPQPAELDREGLSVH